MTSIRERSNAEADFLEVLSVMHETVRYLQKLGIDPLLIKNYHLVFNYLRKNSATIAPEVLGTALRKGARAKKEPLSISDEDLRALTADDVIDLASSSGISRQAMERIATIRFGMTAGGLSVLKSRPALLEKLKTLAQNEGTHESISRIASQPRGGSRP